MPRTPRASSYLLAAAAASMFIVSATLHVSAQRASQGVVVPDDPIWSAQEPHDGRCLRQRGRFESVRGRTDRPQDEGCAFSDSWPGKVTETGRPSKWVVLPTRDGGPHQFR